MIDIATEKLLSLEQAAEKLMVAKQIVMKWIRYGSNGVRLEALKFGSHWRTSEEALQRFGERTTPRFEPTPIVYTRTEREQQKHNEWVKEQLDEMLGVRKCETCRKVLNTQRWPIPKTEKKLWCPQCLIKLPTATISLRIRTFRWEANFSQDELVAKTNIRLELIRDFERGRKEPTSEQLKQLEDALGSDFLLGLNEHDQNSPGHTG